jgi:hypothetical protein
MNGPNLKSGQDGAHKSGQVLTLVCHTPGEPVKGYFSFNIHDQGRSSSQEEDVTWLTRE